MSDIGLHYLQQVRLLWLLRAKVSGSGGGGMMSFPVHNQVHATAVVCSDALHPEPMGFYFSDVILSIS